MPRSDPACVTKSLLKNNDGAAEAEKETVHKKPQVCIFYDPGTKSRDAGSSDKGVST